jgi:hypothetical protein
MSESFSITTPGGSRTYIFTLVIGGLYPLSYRGACEIYYFLILRFWFSFFVWINRKLIHA